MAASPSLPPPSSPCSLPPSYLPPPSMHPEGAYCRRGQYQRKSDDSISGGGGAAAVASSAAAVAATPIDLRRGSVTATTRLILRGQRSRGSDSGLEAVQRVGWAQDEMDLGWRGL